MSTTLPKLLEVLTLEELDVDVYRGQTPETSLQRVFGGQVLGQALMASGLTVPGDRTVHSLHGYFLRPGDPHAPILYLAERLRDGGSFSARRVVARQHGKVIFVMLSSFQVHEDGLEHQLPAPHVPGPDGLPTLFEVTRRRTNGAWPVDPQEWAAIDVRVVEPERPEAGRTGPFGLQVWLKAAGALPDDPLLHAAVLAYASDMTLLSVSAVPHGLVLADPRLMTASLDHAMWFHRAFRADEWLLHDESSPSASNSRGSGQGRVFDRQGRLVATTMQEGLLRQVNSPSGAAPRS